MRPFRRHLGAWTFAWLLCQLASLSATIPAGQLATETVECLGTVDDACPMQDVEGEACPMHNGSDHPDASEQCAMRGLSHAPAIALAALFSIPAVLLAESSVRPDTQAATLRADGVQFASEPVPVDSPPPRS
jgi:hypothetical protein